MFNKNTGGLAMTLVKANNGYYSAIPSLIDRLFSKDWLDWDSSNYSATSTTVPAVNVKETENEYMIEVAAPGMNKNDFHVHLDNNELTISSEKKVEKNDEKENYKRREFSYQSFQRTFTLPENLVNSEKIAAKYNDGILSLVVPKKEEAKPKPAREIKIA